MLFHSFQILKCGQCQYHYSLVMLLNLVINHNINAKLVCFCCWPQKLLVSKNVPWQLIGSNWTWWSSLQYFHHNLFWAVLPAWELVCIVDIWIKSFAQVLWLMLMCLDIWDFPSYLTMHLKLIFCSLTSWALLLFLHSSLNQLCQLWSVTVCA